MRDNGAMKAWDDDALDLDLRRAVAEAWRQAGLHGSTSWRRDEPVEHRFAFEIQGVILTAAVKFTAAIASGEPDPSQARASGVGGQNVEVVCDLSLSDPATGEPWAADESGASFLDEGRDEKLPRGSELAARALGYARSKLSAEPRFVSAREKLQLDRDARRAGPGPGAARL